MLFGDDVVSVDETKQVMISKVERCIEPLESKVFRITHSEHKMYAMLILAKLWEEMRCGPHSLPT